MDNSNYLIFRTIFSIWTIERFLAAEQRQFDVLSAEELFLRNNELIRVPYEDAAKNFVVFHPKDTVDFQPILLMKVNERQEIVLGARDTVYRLNISDLTIVSNFYWPSKSDNIKMCQKKGQKEEDCYNFIRLIAQHQGKLLICGTNAASPSCVYKNIEDLDAADSKLDVSTPFDGIGFVSMNPHYKNVYTITQDGQLISAVATDFATRDPAILRMLPQIQQLRSDYPNDRWLNEPVFVDSFEIGNFVYVFFRELAVEVSAYGKFVYSRVARMCKNDIGMEHNAKKWSTFTKARLNCSLSGPGNSIGFDSLQAVQYVPALNTIFATFSTIGNSIQGSAICVYDVIDLQKAFSGPYFYSDGVNTPWFSYPNRQPDFNCETQGVLSSKPMLTNRPLNDIKQYQLMYEAVQPRNLLPVHVSLLETFSHIDVAVVATKFHKTVVVIFALTASGLLKKFSYRPNQMASETQMCLTEVVEIVPTAHDVRFTVFKLDLESQFLFIGTKTMLLKVPVQRCERNVSERQCLDAKDAYCGWNSQLKQCHVLKGFGTDWYQNLDGCPVVNSPVDGLFGPWSLWASCPQQGETGENCLCRSRPCDNPAPKHGGKPCVGPTIQVANCTQNGVWALWTEWSPCVATCGSSIRSRKRTCTNPAPSFGGRICLGLDTQQEFCSFTPCPTPVPTPVHGGWSQWSIWTPCTKPCNSGVQKRRRFCDAPLPAFNGTYCVGDSLQHEICNDHTCAETRLWSEWTPWLQSNVTLSNNAHMKRYRTACNARVQDVSLLTVSPMKFEEKVCRPNSLDCEQSNFRSVDGHWSAWSVWSTCTASCGNGNQFRTRQCNTPAPVGNGLTCSDHAKEIRFCNTGTCESRWSCWSEYSDCSATCGRGYKHRRRTCTHVIGTAPCPGDRVESVACDSGPCMQDGFGEWSGWSTCNRLGVHVRIRPCMSSSYCKGIPDAQMQQCHYISDVDADKSGYSLAASTEQPRRLGVLFVASVAGAFLCGAVLCLVLSWCGPCGLHRGTCPLIGQLKKRSATLSTNSASLFSTVQSPSSIGGMVPMSPVTPVKSNIYTPPPTLRSAIVFGAGSVGRGVKPKDKDNRHHKMQCRRNGSRSECKGHVTVNPLLDTRVSKRRAGSYVEDSEYDYGGLSADEYGRPGTGAVSLSATLKKTMRASLKTQDYL